MDIGVFEKVKETEKLEINSPVIKDDATLYNTVEQIGLGWVSGRYFSVSFRSLFACYVCQLHFVFFILLF